MSQQDDAIIDGGDGGNIFYPRIMPTGLANEGGAFLSSYASHSSAANAYFALNGISLEDASWPSNGLATSGISISLSVETPEGEELSFVGGGANGPIDSNADWIFLEQNGDGAIIDAAIERNKTTFLPASAEDHIYSVKISTANEAYLDGEYKITGLSIVKDGVETSVATPSEGVPVYVIDDSDVRFWVSQSSDVVYERADRTFVGTDDVDELVLDGTPDDYEYLSLGDLSAQFTHKASGSVITVTDTEEAWFSDGSNVMLADIPLISSNLTSAELLELVPDFEGVTQADLSLPFVFWDKPNGDEYVVADTPVAQTEDLYLWVVDWQGGKIILGSPRVNDTSTLVKLNLAENPELSGSNFLANIELYEQWIEGGLDEEAISPFVDDPDNSFGLSGNTGSSVTPSPLFVQGSSEGEGSSSGEHEGENHGGDDSNSGDDASSEASFYYHIDANGNYWFPLFQDLNEAIAVDQLLYGSSSPGAHTHVFDGNTWYMPDTMGIVGGDGSFHEVALSNEGIQGLLDAGGASTSVFGGEDTGNSSVEDLIVDGSFDDEGAWFGNGYNSVGGFNQVVVESAGQVWDVNLSQVVSITPGAAYTLTFEVSGSEGRSLVAGIGLNEDPWTANHVTINLTESSHQVVLHLNAVGNDVAAAGVFEFGGDNSRVLFDMGGDIGAVNIDNVSLLNGHVGTAGVFDFDGNKIDDGSSHGEGDPIGPEGDGDEHEPDREDEEIFAELPLISGVLPASDLIDLVPEFANVDQADLSLPLVFWDKLNGDEYVTGIVPAAQTDGLYLWVGEWNGQNIILGSLKDYDSPTLIKLNLASDPIGQNTNFEIDVDFYTSFMAGELRTFESNNQYIDDPDNAYGLAPLEVLDEQPDISDVPQLEDLDASTLKFIKLTPGSDRYDNVLAEEALQITAGDGDDFIVASPETDLLEGGDGNDLIKGNQGSDLLFGGLGDDVFLQDFRGISVPAPITGARAELLSVSSGPSSVTDSGIAFFTFGVSSANGDIADKIEAQVTTPYGQITKFANYPANSMFLGAGPSINVSTLQDEDGNGGMVYAVVITASEPNSDGSALTYVDLPPGQYSIDWAQFFNGVDFMAEPSPEFLEEIVVNVADNQSENIQHFNSSDSTLGFPANSDNIDGGEHFDILRVSNTEGDFQLYDGDDFAVLVHKWSGEKVKLTNVEKIEFANSEVMLKSGAGLNAPAVPKPDVEYFSESFVDLDDNTIIEFFAEGGSKDDVIIFRDNISGGAGNDILLEDSDENLTPLGDVLKGGKGNDFLDGGEQGSAGSGYENFNVAEFDGPARNFSFETKIYSDQADKAEIDALIVDLNLEAAEEYLVEGASYYIVSDSRGDKGQGTDIVTNVQAFDFTDDYLTLEASLYTYSSSTNIFPDGFYIAPGMTPIETGVMERPAYWNPEISEYSNGNDGWDVYEYEIDGENTDGSYVVFFQRFYDGAPAYDGYVHGPVYEVDVDGNYVPLLINEVTLEGAGSAIANDLIDASTHEANPTKANLSGAGGNDILIGTSGDDRLEGNSGNDFIDARGTSDRDELNFSNIKQSRFDISSMTYTEGGDKDALDTLIVDLGLSAASDYLVDGQQYLIVADKRGGSGEGTDIVSNIEAISFKDNHIRLTAEEYVRTDFFEVNPEDFYVSATDAPVATGIQVRIQRGGYLEDFSNSGYTHGWDAYSYDYADGEQGTDYFVLFRRDNETSNQGQGYIDGGVYKFNANGQYQAVTKEIVRLDSYGSAYADDILNASARSDSPGSSFMDGKGGDDILIGTLGADSLRGGQGNDFIDGRGSAEKVNRWDEDRVDYNGKLGQYTLTHFDMNETADVEAFGALVESLGLNIDDYVNPNANYFVSIEDKVGGRDGIDIITGVDRINFNDDSLRLTVEERSSTEERELQTPWSWRPEDGNTPVETIDSFFDRWGNAQEKWNQDSEWRVYAYDDGDDSTELFVVFNYEEYEWGSHGWPEALVTRSDDGQGGFVYTRATQTQSRYDATGSFLPDEITTDADQAHINARGGDDVISLAKEGWVDAGAGNDVIYGGTGQNELTGGAGNDVIVGGANAGGEDRARFNGEEKFFDIYQLRFAGNDMEIKDALGNLIYSVTSQANGSGILKFAGDSQEILNLSNGDSFIVVNDLLPAKFGGQGVDLLTGIERIEFQGDNHSSIQTGVSFWDDTWSNRTEANGSIFDDLMDFRDGRAVSVEAVKARGGRADDIQAQGQLHASNMRGEEGNDVMLGGYGRDFFNPGKGDDFIDGGSEADLEGLVASMDVFRSNVALTDPEKSEDGFFDVYRVHNENDEYWALRSNGTLFKVNYNEQQNSLISTNSGDQNNNDRWTNNDTVQYSGTRLRYEISSVYVELDENGLPVQDLEGQYNVMEAADFIAPDDVGFERFFRVKDVLPDAAGGVGTDYLRNIEELYFSDGNEQLAVVTDRWTDRYDRNDWSWQPPRDNNGDYDLSSNDGAIDGFTSMWGGFSEKWNEDAEWLVFKYLDSNGDQVFEDSHGLYVIWNSEGDWGHPIRLVRQDGAGGYTEVFNTQERASVRGTFADDIIYQTSDANSNDEIYANEGNDIILAGEGRDRIKGGEGNDVIFGGGQTSIGWDYNGDIAYYGSSSSQYIITRNIFVKPTDNVVETDDRGRFIVYSESDVAGRGITQGETELALTSDNGFVEATIVTDTLPGSQGGEGVDILVGIEGLVFGSSSNWLPHVGSYARSGDSVGGDDGGVFVGLSSTLAINAYQYGNTTKIDADLFGTEFDDNIALPAADSNIFSRDGIGYLGSQVTNAFFKTDAGSDSYTGSEAVFSEVHYDGAEEDYEVASNTDGSISVKHLVVGEDNTGIDTLISIDKIVFGEGSSGEERSEVLLSLNTRSYDYYNHLTGTNFDDVIDMRSGLSFATEKNSYSRTYDGEFTEDTVQYHDRFWAGSGNDIMLGGYGGDFFYSDAGDDFIDGGRASDLDAILAASTSVAQNVSLVDPENSVDGYFDIYFVLSGERNGERGEYWALRDDGSSFRVDADLTDEENPVYSAADLGGQNNSWVSDDSVEYSSGTKARYVIDEVYIKIGDNGHPVRIADGYDTIEVANFASEAGYEKVTRVADKLPEVAGGTGTDYLKNIDVLRFSDGDERLSPETNSWTNRYEKNDYDWRPPESGGNYDVSGGTQITEYLSAYGDLRAKDQESWDSSTWYVFQHTDGNGDAIAGQFILWHHRQEENYSWGWSDRLLESDGNGGYQQLFNTTTRTDVRGTLNADTLTQTVASDDEIKGYGGDDTIVAGDGRDQIKGGVGNDVIWGGDSDSFGWDFNGDIAYFEAPKDQYKVIRGVFVKPETANGELVNSRPETDAEGRFIVYSADADLVGRGIVRQATSDDLTEANGYYEATIVIDTLADELGGEGVDVLIGVEGAVFGSSTDWLPHVGSYISSGDSVGSGQEKFIGLQPTTLVETYEEVRLRVKGTDFNDSVAFNSDDVFFDRNSQPYDGASLDNIYITGSSGDDVYDLRNLSASDGQKLLFSMAYDFNEASEYSISRASDGGVRIEHLVEGPNNTGTDIVYGQGEIRFNGDQPRTYHTIENNTVWLSWLGDDLDSDVADFAAIQENDNEVLAFGGYGFTSNVDAGEGNDTLRMEDTPIWLVDITYLNGVWTVTNNMGQSYGSNGTVNATDFETIRLEHRDTDYWGYINIADPDNVTIEINGTQYQVASYGSEGQLLNADGDRLIDQIRADVGFPDATLTGTAENDEFHALPGDRIIFGGDETDSQEWYGFGDQYRISGTSQRYTISYKYDEDEDGDGLFDATGVSVSGNETLIFGDGQAFVKYVEVVDSLSDDLGGTGTDLLFDVENIYAEGNNMRPVDPYNGSSSWYRLNSVLSDDIVKADIDVIDGLSAQGSSVNPASLDYEVDFGDVVVGTNGSAQNLSETVMLGAQSDKVGVLVNTLSFDALDTYDLNNDGTVGDTQDKIVANLLTDLDTGIEGATIDQLVISDKAGMQDELVIFGVDQVRIGNTNFNLTVTTNRDSDGKIWDVRGTELSDTLIGDDTENNFYSGAGTDFVDGVANVAIEGQYWTPRDYLRFEGVNFERAEFNAVQVVVNADGTPGLDADKKIQIVGYTGEAAIDNADISFAASAEAFTLGDGQELVAASMVSDRFAASDDSYFGVKIVRNIDGVSFDDRWLDLSVYENVREETYGANNTPYNQRDLQGTILDDVMLGDGSLDGGARDRLEGRDGNDRLIGGAWGDELIGGLGDDIIDGGADGLSGDVWRDLDVARYNDNALVRYTISKVHVAADFDAASDTPTIYDPSGIIESAGIFTLNQDAAAYEAAKDTLKAAYLVVDALGAELGGTGHDLVIDVERLEFADNENVDLGLRIERNDWDSNQAGYERVSISGTNEGDDIRDYGNGIDFDGDGNTDDDLIARKEIDGGDGDDVIFAYGGGSRIIGGTGSDFIDGGADGTSGNSWDDEDRAVFSGKSSRYSLEGTTKLDPSLQSIAQALGVDLGNYSDDQEFTLVRDEAAENGDVDVLVNVERIQFSDRDFSIKPIVRIEFDGDGNEVRRNVEGSIKSDILLGGQFDDWIQGRQGDDLIFAGDGGDDINPGAGTDYVDGGANNNYSDDIYWNPSDTVRIDSSFENFEVAKAKILVSTGTGQPIVGNDGNWTIIGYLGEAALLSDKISFVDSADGLTSDAVSAVDVYMISDNRAPSDNAYKGVNIIRNVENLSFNDKWVQIEPEVYTNEYTDWRGDKIVESRRNGTIFSEAIIGGLGNDFIEGREGDDYLFGGADGDRLNGGRGNDILWGGADGNSGDTWRDLDIAEYWNESKERFQIYKVKVDTDQFESFLAGQPTTIVDAFGVFEGGMSFEGYSIASSSDAELSDAYLVADFLPAALGGAGNDLLIDIEQINFEGESVDLGLRIWADDWNQDEVLDWVRVEGTGEDDDIRDWGDEARLSADSEILGKAGNDILFGYEGGDRLSGGTGNDFIDGGADGIQRYGWTPKDEAFFNGVEANYSITNYLYGDPILTELAEELGYSDLLLTYAPTEGELAPSFTVVRDTKPAQLGGSGTDILVNVEFIGLQDNYLPLAVEKNADMRADSDSDGDGLYDITRESVDDPNAIGEYAVYWVSGTSNSDRISGGIGDDYLSGNAGDDTLVGDRGADFFEPGAGDDYIDGGANGFFEWNRDDVVRFSGKFSDYDIGSGFDDAGRLEVIVTDLREEGDGINRLVNIERIEFDDQSISIGVSERIIYSRNDLINGLEIRGSSFDDIIEGTYPSDANASGLQELGNDYLSGEEGDDVLYGYAGQDTFVGGLGNDKIYGGENGVDEFGNEGGDTVIYFQNYSNYTIQYKTSGGLDSDSYSESGYIVVEDKSDDEYSDGLDEIHGVERIVFADTELTFEAKIESIDADGDGIADIASITGTNQDDLLYGTELDEVFAGEAGNDEIFGRAGNDTFEDSGSDGNDLYFGGGGEDRLSLGLGSSNYSVDQTFIASGAQGEIIRDSSGNIIFFDSIEDVTDGASARAAVTLTNNNNGEVDVVAGVEYVDFNGDLTALNVSVGRAKFANDGSLSQIDVFGTLGDDTINAESLAASGAFAEEAANAIMAADNFIFGGRGTDEINAGAGNDQIILDTSLDSGGASDIVNGGSGVDRVDLAGSQSEWTKSSETLNGVTYDKFSKNSHSILLSEVEAVSFDDETLNLIVTSIDIDRNSDGAVDGYQISGTPDDDDVVANAGGLQDILKGGAGDDLIVGLGGNDNVIEGAGDDFIMGGSGFDTVSYADLAANSAISGAGFVLRNLSDNKLVGSYESEPAYLNEADVVSSSLPMIFSSIETSYVALVAEDFDADNSAETSDLLHVDTDWDGETDSYFADLNNDGHADLFADGSDTEAFDAASMALRKVTLAKVNADSDPKIFYENVASEKVFSVVNSENTDLIIGVELVEFSDKAVSMLPSISEQSSFSGAAGIVQTREVLGTGFADVINVEAIDEVLHLGEGNDFVRLGSDSGMDTITDFDVKSDVVTNYASVDAAFDPDNNTETADLVSIDVDGDGASESYADLDNDGVVDRFDDGADDVNFDPEAMSLKAIEIIDEAFDVIEIEKFLNGTSVGSYESLRSRMSETNMGVEISLGVNSENEEQQVILEGVTIDELSASNFAFVDVL